MKATTICSGWSVLLVVTIVIGTTNSIPLNQFVPFGSNAGDSRLPQGSSVASQVITIPTRFPFFNGTYGIIFVSLNGYLSFNYWSVFSTPVRFPFKHVAASLICPFWANVDTTTSGAVYYRHVGRSAVIDSEIRRYFSNAAGFTATWILIATWRNVGYFSSHADKVNTFQAVIATNGRESYAIFNYLDGGIQWSSADNTGGVNGIGVSGAQVGFNGGDGVHFYVRPEVINDLILQLDDNSNVCIPGKYVFRIDGEKVQPGRCVDIKADSCSQNGYSNLSPSLMISNGSSIISVNLETDAITPLVSNLYYTLGIGYDLVDRMFYWSEIAYGKIQRVSFDKGLDGSAVETIVTGLLNPEQIAIDWINRKLYWTDHRLGVIQRSNLDGSNIELLVNIAATPQAIAIDPIHGTLFWINWQVPRRIEKMEMSGILRRTIAQENVERPLGLTIDYENNLLYWADDFYNVLWECDLEGSNRRFLRPFSAIDFPYAVEIFQSTLYWTDTTHPFVGVANPVTGTSIRNISTMLVEPGGIHVIDYSRQPGTIVPFIIKDSFISNTKILAPEGFTLSVEFIAVCIKYDITWKFNGKLINNDTNHLITKKSVSSSRYMTSLTIKESSEGVSGVYSLMVSSVHGSDNVNISVEIINDCSPPVISNPYLLVADYNGIRQMNLNGTDRHTVISNLYNIHGLDFDILTNMLYWCDVDLGTIHRASIGGDGKELIISGLSRPEEVAVDWINRKLYWCDYGNNTIEYSDLDGSGRTVLVNTGLDQPRGMAIDPSSGHIYWTDWGAVPKIEKMKLDGTEREVIVNSSLVWPNGLTIDYEESRLYWTDAYLDKVESSDLDGNGRVKLYEDVPHPYGITKYKDFLYWTDWVTRAIVTAHVSGNEETLVNTTYRIRPSGIVVVHHSRQPGACGSYRQCISSAQKPSIMVAKDSSIEEYSLTGADEEILFKGKYKLTGGVDVDIANNSVYWSSASGNIYRFNSDGNSLIHDRVGIPKNILVNWITRKLYWINDGNNEITYSDLDGSDKQILVKTNDRLLAIALEPRHNYIYWCSHNSKNGALIEKMELNGTNREVVISENLRRPTSMIIDYTNEKLYWADADRKVIELTDLEGRVRSTVCHINSRQPTIALYDSIIYWTDTTSVHRCTTDGNNLGKLITTSSIKGVIIKHQSKQPGACSATTTG